jgi:small-conductance mechanosensitive channel
MAERVQTARDERGWFSRSPGIAALWTGILAGPIAWAIDLTSSYAIVQWTCSSQHTFVLHLVTLAALAITAIGAAAAFTGLQRAPEEATDDGPRPIDRGRFMALLGLLISAMFALLVISNDIPRLVLDACL